MNPTPFPDQNCQFGPPPGYDESQVRTINAYQGTVTGQTNVDGVPVIVTAYKPTPEELADLIAGGRIYVSHCMAGLPPHFLTTHFQAAKNPGVPLLSLNCPACNHFNVSTRAPNLMHCEKCEMQISVTP